MATSTLAPSAKQYFWHTVTGAPLAGGYVYTYLAGTSTPQTTYQDSAGLIPNSNPVVLNSAGFATIYLSVGASYKFVVTDGAAPFPVAATSIVGVTHWSQDNILAVPIASPAVDISGTAGDAFAANQPAYLSSANTWRLADNTAAASSTLPLIGFAVTAIANGAVGTFRIGGPLTGLAGLTPGFPYYVGVAGAITLTPPASNIRFVGQADSTTELIIATNPPGLPSTLPDVGLCEGRLTLTTGVPVTKTDVTAAATIYFTPYKGNRVALFDGNTLTWQVFKFTEVNLPLGTLTAALPYDVFLTQTAGAFALSLVAWTSATVRAVALAVQDGVYITASGVGGPRYVGTIYTASATTTEDSQAKRYVWNYYNRVPRALRVIEAAASWTYTTAAWRQANANTANQLDLVVGVAEEALVINVIAAGSNGTAAFLNAGIGEDGVVNPVAASNAGVQTPGSATTILPLVATMTKVPLEGRHYYPWMEASQVAGTSTFYGLNTTVGGNTQDSQIIGWWKA